MVQRHPLEIMVKMPVSPLRQLHLTKMVPAKEAAVPLYHDLSAVTTYLKTFFEDVAITLTFCLGNGAGFAKNLAPERADTHLRVMLGNDALIANCKDI